MFPAICVGLPATCRIWWISAVVVDFPFDPVIATTRSSGPTRTVTGTTPDGRRTLIIWRKLNGEPEQDNLVLDEWFTRQGYSSKDSEFDLIYVNGGNNLENLKTPDDTWKVRLIEEDFHRLMFETEGA